MAAADVTPRAPLGLGRRHSCWGHALALSTLIDTRPSEDENHLPDQRANALPCLLPTGIAVNWVELLVAQLLHVHPTLKAQLQLGPLVAKCAQAKPPGQGQAAMQVRSAPFDTYPLRNTCRTWSRGFGVDLSAR